MNGITSRKGENYVAYTKNFIQNTNNLKLSIIQYLCNILKKIIKLKYLVNFKLDNFTKETKRMDLHTVIMKKGHSTVLQPSHRI